MSDYDLSLSDDEVPLSVLRNNQNYNNQHNDNNINLIELAGIENDDQDKQQPNENEAPNLNENQINSEESNNKKRKLRSWVWNYFVQANKEKSECKICGEHINFVRGSCTNNMINHLNNRHHVTE